VSDEQLRADAMALVNMMIADAEIEELEAAESYIALTTNAETLGIHINGTFPDAASALAWAEVHTEELNEGMPPDDAPYTVRVFPMLGTS
jgi:hypothetical protein